MDPRLENLLLNAQIHGTPYEGGDMYEGGGKGDYIGYVRNIWLPNNPGYTWKEGMKYASETGDYANFKQFLPYEKMKPKKRAYKRKAVKKKVVRKKATRKKPANAWNKCRAKNKGKKLSLGQVSALYCKANGICYANVKNNKRLCPPGQKKKIISKPKTGMVRQKSIPKLTKGVNKILKQHNVPIKKATNADMTKLMNEMEILMKEGKNLNRQYNDYQMRYEEEHDIRKLPKANIKKSIEEVDIRKLQKANIKKSMEEVEAIMKDTDYLMRENNQLEQIDYFRNRPPTEFDESMLLLTDDEALRQLCGSDCDNDHIERSKVRGLKDTSMLGNPQTLTREEITDIEDLLEAISKAPVFNNKLYMQDDKIILNITIKIAENIIKAIKEDEKITPKMKPVVRAAVLEQIYTDMQDRTSSLWDWLAEQIYK